MNSYRFRHLSDSERHLGRPPSSAGDDSSLAREPVLGEFFCVGNGLFFGIEVAQGPIRRLRVKPDLRENHLGGEFALVGWAPCAIRFIAAQCKNSLHWIANFRDVEIVARRTTTVSWSSDFPCMDRLERGVR